MSDEAMLHVNIIKSFQPPTESVNVLKSSCVEQC